MTNKKTRYEEISGDRKGTITFKSEYIGFLYTAKIYTKGKSVGALKTYAVLEARKFVSDHLAA